MAVPGIRASRGTNPESWAVVIAAAVIGLAVSIAGVAITRSVTPAMGPVGVSPPWYDARYFDRINSAITSSTVSSESQSHSKNATGAQSTDRGGLATVLSGRPGRLCWDGSHAAGLTHPLGEDCGEP